MVYHQELDPRLELSVAVAVVVEEVHLCKRELKKKTPFSLQHCDSDAKLVLNFEEGRSHLPCVDR